MSDCSQQSCWAGRLAAQSTSKAAVRGGKGSVMGTVMTGRASDSLD